MDYKQFCEKTYRAVFESAYREAMGHSSSPEIIRRMAQKVAVDETFIQALMKYHDQVSDDDIWKAIGQVHKVYFAQLDRFGISEEEQVAIVERCISAHQSWIKMSGHCFERYIANVANEKLQQNEISFILQKELTKRLRRNELSNTSEDLEVLAQYGKNFDLYAVQTIHGKTRVFGCIQSKTSIRDRVGRDLPFSYEAMKGLFWSVGVTLNGDFLKMPEFVNMVNGGEGTSYIQNGWHGMYAITGVNADNKRIYKIDEHLSKLFDHAVQASE